MEVVVEILGIAKEESVKKRCLAKRGVRTEPRRKLTFRELEALDEPLKEAEEELSEERGLVEGTGHVSHGEDSGET